MFRLDRFCKPERSGQLHSAYYLNGTSSKMYEPFVTEELMTDVIDFAGVPTLPQTNFLHQLAPRLWQRPDVLALWLEGSLARGNSDRYSDVDLYVGVEPATLTEWRDLDVPALFGAHYAAHLFSHFSDDFFVYHVYLTAGGIYDLHIQSRNRELPRMHRLVLAGRDVAYVAALRAAAPEPAADNLQAFGPQALDPTILPSLVNFFWINADKGRKVIYRNQEFTVYTGFHLLRHTIARLLFIEQTGNDCGDLTRPSIHGMKAAALVLKETWGDKLGQWMGAPATTLLELCQTQILLHNQVARVGRVLAARYQFAYPEALEQTVRTNWRQFMVEELGQA